MFVVLKDPNKDKSTREDIIREKITRDSVILYRQNYKISIISYNFKLIQWTISKTNNIESLKALTI